MKESEAMKSVETRPSSSTPRYSAEFKVGIARKVIEEHVKQTELSAETKVALSWIKRWVAMARRGALPGYTAPTFDEKTGDLAAENKRLARELARVRGERDFLKRAAAFFAKETP